MNFLRELKIAIKKSIQIVWEQTLKVLTTKMIDLIFVTLLSKLFTRLISLVPAVIAVLVQEVLN